ncbi:MAG TPA: hypothetical protein VFV97_05320 [Rhodanobacteraceae bacterium]|nr:hypothetical protein [Rhodanobacteraceae bacterium]
MRHFVIATLASLAIARGAAAQSVDPYAPVPEGPPASLAIDADGKVLITGNFSQVGTDTRHGVARLDVDGSVDETFGDPGANGNVIAVAVLPDGKVLIGGDFTEVGGQTRHSLARLNADGSLDAGFADPGFNASVWVIAVQPDGRIFAGGSFTAIGAHVQNYLARLDADGAFDSSFADPQLCCDPLVDALALQANGDILVGGAFSQAGGQNDRFYFVRFSSNGTLDPSFPATATAPQPGALMVAPDGSIYLSNNGTGLMMKLDADGTPSGAFGSAATDGEIYSFVLQPNGKILIGGTFANVAGAPHHALARLNADGSLDASFADVHLSFDAANPAGFLYGVAAQADGKPVVIGNFTLADSEPHQYIARVATGDYATSALVVQPDGANVDVTWYRLGDGPELGAAPTLMHSSDGVTFTAVGPMVRVANGWRASAPFDVHGARFYLEAAGMTGSGAEDGSPGQVASAIYSSDTIFADGFE